MKRGKDDEKVMGPLFPRLHVSDTEKGGPRAPPRNKMALYEQFSIPSQRFNSGLLPLHPSTSNNTVPPASSSQGNVTERNYAFPVHLPPQTPNHGIEKHISRQSSEGENLNTSLVQLEQQKKTDEDDFMVPVYTRSRIGQSNDKSLEKFDGKKPTFTGSRYFGCSIAGKNDCERDPKQYGSPLVNTRTDVRNETDGPPQVSPSKKQPLKSARDLSTGENTDSLKRQAKVTPNQEFQDCAVSKLSRLRQGYAGLRQDSGAESQSNGFRQRQSDGFIESTKEAERNGGPTANQTNPTEAINDTEYHDTRTGSPMRRGNFNKNDYVSKISRVENLSTLKVSPDDVVAIIGQKHFWKARKAIANQQRVFAVQVFELHRLIKVQQLIAESPDLLYDGAFLGKSPPKGSTKKLPLQYAVKPREQNLKRKDDSEKINKIMEHSAENVVGKTSLSSVKNGSHLSNYTPFTGNPHQANMAADSGIGSWCFPQPPGHQWLIPFMSPSEGLVYKPYPGPEFTGTNGGPFVGAPLGGTFMNTAYGMPAPQNTPPGSHAYFPPYSGTPVMNAAISESAVEQVNQSSALDSRGQNGHLSGVEADRNPRNKSSCKLSVQRNGATSHAMDHKRYKGFEFQGSTASSPSEMTQGMSREQVTEGRDVLPLFPMVTAEPEPEPEGVPQSLEPEQQTRVIKVVPHNRRSANESAARIFQSIQEERKQFDLF